MRYSYPHHSLNLHGVSKLHIEHVDVGSARSPILVTRLTVLDYNNEPTFTITLFNYDQRALLPIEIEVSDEAKHADTSTVEPTE